MIVQCKKCSAKYRIEDWRVKKTGSKVRCSRCGHVFFVMVSEDPSEGLGAESEGDFSSGIVNNEAGKEVHSGTRKSHQATQPSIDSENETVEQGRSSQPQEGLKNGSAKESGDEFSWDGFISRSEVDSNDPDTDRPKANPGGERKRGSSEFTWDSLSIGDEDEGPVIETPNLFNEAPEEISNDLTKNKPQTERENEYVKSASDRLLVDMEGLQPEVGRTRAQNQYFSESTTFLSYKLKKSGFASSRIGALKRAASILFTFLIFVVLVGAGVVIAMNMEMIPKDKSEKITSLALSILPAGLLQSSGDANLLISAQDGRWVSTKNGNIYVVTGQVTNGSGSVVNYIKLKSEFTSGGKKLFEQIAYAGNTFTEEELENDSLEEIGQRLGRKNGDIDFENRQKLAGLNYNIQPGESVPFFTVFPAESKVLGLKYDIQIVDFERVNLE